MARGRPRRQRSEIIGPGAGAAAAGVEMGVEVDVEVERWDDAATGKWMR